MNDESVAELSGVSKRFGNVLAPLVAKPLGPEITLDPAAKN
jgi:hypothetical protein